MAGSEKLVPRWGQPLTGIIATVTFTLIAWIMWYIFADPTGIFKNYEQPFLAFLAWMILIGLWQHLIFDDWPFKRLKPLARMTVQATINLIATWFMIYVIFDKFLGKVIFPLWSTTKLSAITGKPAEALWESPVGTALTLIVLTGFFTYAFWTIIFQKWPFGGKLEQPALGLAEWSITTVVTILFYSLLFVPFFLLAMKDPLAGTIWWEKVGGTKSANYIIGIYEWMIVYLFMTANIWEGKPWHLVKKQPLRGIVAFISIVLMAFGTMQVLMWGMELFYGPPSLSIKDGIGSLDYRYYHTASLAGFTLFPFLAWNHYFDNWPKKFGAVTGWVIRTVGVFVVAAMLTFLYYKFCLPILGLEPVLSNHENKPLVWLFWWLIPLLWNDWFGAKYPFYIEESVAKSITPTSNNNIKA